MPYKTATLTLLAVIGIFFMAAGPAVAQPSDMSDIGNATVTLYYFDNASKTKGAIVPMDDNPQHVNWDPALAAPGMYTFSHVPAGQWYYLEADHNGNKWYATFYMEENVGTVTRNIHIPPLSPVNASEEVVIKPGEAPGQTTATPAASIPVPSLSEGRVRATPGMTSLAAALAAVLAIALMARKRR